MLRNNTDAHVSSLGYLWPNVHAMTENLIREEKGREGKIERLQRAGGERKEAKRKEQWVEL